MILSDRLDLIRGHYRRIIDEYGFSVSVVDKYRVTLATGNVRIELSSDRYYADLFVYVYATDREPEKQFSLLYMIGCRVPERLRNTRADDEAPSTAQEDLARKLVLTSEVLLEYFDDVLRGEFGRLESDDDYEQFAHDADTLCYYVYKLELDNPISRKLRSCDFSWIGDVKARLREEGISDPGAWLKLEHQKSLAAYERSNKYWERVKHEFSHRMRTRWRVLAADTVISILVILFLFGLAYLVS